MKRLTDLGADTVKVFSYDSLVGPKNKHVVYTFDAHNVLAEFSPLQESSGDVTDLLLVAHYDSRYSQPFARDTVWSYGAADDGYGVGVILETVSQLLKERADWKQGVKVLFTDAEEVGMMGMTAMWENDKAEFDNVGLMINVEARGPWGPALLFEACPGNSKVIDLYASKDSIPGLNFSTITDVNHYHTHLDNFSNISEKSIQHYGEQILPLAREYVKNQAYSDVEAMKASNDAVNFTVPGIGLLNFSKVGYVIVNSAIFLIFLLLFGLEGIRGRLKASKVFLKSVTVLGFALVALVAGEIVAYISGLIAGVSFKPFGIMQGIMFDNAVMIASVALMAVISILVYLSVRVKAARASSGSMRASASYNAVRAHAFNSLYGSLALAFFLSAILLAALGENMMFLIPLACATAGMLLYHLTNLRVWLLAAIVLILLHAFSFYYALAMALTIGALGAVMMLAFIDIMILIPLADIYLMPARKK